MTKPRKKPFSLFIQLVIGFVIPTIILMAYSDESKLGPVVAMALALAFPIALEVYSFFTGRKASWLSLFAIIGILLIGAISFFGLSEEWLGIRRAGFYIIAAIGIAAVLLFRRDWLDKGLGKLVDMQAVRKAAEKNGTEAEISRHITKVAYMFVAFLTIIALWSYILTIMVIDAPTGSSEFNAQYAELRLLGLPYVSGPLLIGMTVLLVYLVMGFEKYTGIDIEELLKKKKK